MKQDQRPANDSIHETKKPASTKRPSLFRSRRRADRLPATELRSVQAGFEIRRNTEDVGRDHLLPRAEAVDAVLIGITANIRFLSDQVNHIRRQMGMATTSTGGLFLEKGDKLSARQFVQQERRSA